MKTFRILRAYLSKSSKKDIYVKIWEKNKTKLYVKQRYFDNKPWFSNFRIRLINCTRIFVNNVYKIEIK